ncbi:hypothetical protein SLS64_009594 [Diaporthe eres]
MALMRTTEFEFLYLKRQNKGVLRQHIVQEAKELNELNTRFRRVECWLAMDARPVSYKSLHGSNIHTVFETDHAQHIPKIDLVYRLQRIRNTRNQVGSLYTKPGEWPQRIAHRSKQCDQSNIGFPKDDPLAVPD